MPAVQRRRAGQRAVDDAGQQADGADQAARHQRHAAVEYHNAANTVTLRVYTVQQDSRSLALQGVMDGTMTRKPRADLVSLLKCIFTSTSSIAYSRLVL